MEGIYFKIDSFFPSFITKGHSFVKLEYNINRQKLKTVIMLNGESIVKEYEMIYKDTFVCWIYFKLILHWNIRSASMEKDY